MKIIDKKYYDSYYEIIGKDIDSLIRSYDFASKQSNFDYLIKASAVYSSNIEGNSIDLNSFMNYELSKKNSKQEKKLKKLKTSFQLIIMPKTIH